LELRRRFPKARARVPFRNSDAKDGLWKIGERRQAVYAKAELSSNEQRVAVQNKYGQ